MRSTMRSASAAATFSSGSSVASEVDMASCSLSNDDADAFEAVLRNATSPGLVINSLTSSGRTVLGLAVSSGDASLVQLCLEVSSSSAQTKFAGENVRDSRARLEARSLPTSPAMQRRDGHGQSDVVRCGEGDGTSSDCRTPKSNDEESVSSKICRQRHPPSKARLPRDCGQCQWAPFDAASSRSVVASLEQRCMRIAMVDVNRHDFFDRAPLHYAAELACPDILRMLLDKGASVNVSDAIGLSPLHVSVFRGRLENVKLLIASGARLNAKSVEKLTPLHMAASYGYSDICVALLMAGAEIDALDSSERTPLMLAMQQHQQDTIELLIRDGANVNAKEIHGESPLVAAVWANDVEIVRLLLKAGARITPADGLLQTAILHHSPTLVNVLLPYIPLPLPRNSVGDTPQIIAVREKQFDIFLSLVLHGADLSSKNYIIGDTLLHCLVRSFTEPFDLELFRSFLRVLVDFNFRDLDSESYVQGETPLFCAVISGKLKFAMLLVAYGCNPNAGHAFTCKSIDVLRVARKKGSLNLVRLLIDAGYALGAGLEPLPPPVPPDLSPIEDFLAQVAKNAMPLKKLTRLAVRAHLRRPWQKSLAQLPLPQSLKDYLQFVEYVELL